MRFFTLMALISLILCGCQSSPQGRANTAQEIAGTLMTKKTIAASPFIITTYEHIEKPGSTATIYIEGDGLAWLGRRTPSLDPTPLDPMPLKLATLDPAENRIYMARPCQYSKTVHRGICEQKYWTSHRFAPEVIQSMNAALDDIKNRNNLTDFNLVGFSGGGAVAVLMASSRTDILSIRTIAGNLDHDRLNAIHRVTPMPGSLNAATFAPRVAHIPQHHFIGGKDTVVTPPVYHSYRAAAGPSTCIRHTLLPQATHEKGWTERWTGLLQAPLDCNVIN